MTFVVFDPIPQLSCAAMVKGPKTASIALVVAAGIERQSGNANLPVR
jgi:hypothetical protein